MKKSFLVKNVTVVYGDEGVVRLKFTDMYTGDELVSNPVIKTKDYENGSWIVHETETEYLLEERR